MQDEGASSTDGEPLENIQHELALAGATLNSQVQQLLEQSDTLTTVQAEVKRLEAALEESEAARDAQTVVNGTLQVRVLHLMYSCSLHLMSRRADGLEWHSAGVCRLLHLVFS